MGGVVAEGGGETARTTATMLEKLFLLCEINGRREKLVRRCLASAAAATGKNGIIFHGFLRNKYTEDPPCC